MKALGEIFHPKEIEHDIYVNWIEQGYFHTKVDKNKKPYTIVISSPNVTGVLHMGHGLNNTLQDILIRYHRMKGYSALWVPGTDHAGIATQNVVERRLKSEGKNKHDFGRDKFIELTWKVKEEHHKTITEQLKRIGSSVDWQRERFTLDEGLSDAVKEVFVNLYKEGLIYRGKYLINYCPSCGTALANDEVDHKETDGALYHVKYKIKDSDEYIEIATTRPETMLGDTAIAVNPNDERYKHLSNDTIIILPVVNRELRLIKDEYVDMEFGTGALKITPAHDMNDFVLAQKYNLPIINILTENGSINDNAPNDYIALTREDARKKIIEDLESLGLYIGKNDIKHQVGHCYRCHNAIEPYYSDQWFVKMKPLAEKALSVIADGSINIYPERWINTYNHWLTDIRDWCISRQLWWGHRIPVWYCDDCSHMTVSKTIATECEECQSKNIRQDEDVLDTWFSSWLWPFSTLGWPKNTEDLQYFYPTSTLVSAYDIIFFWIARMVMAGTHFMKNIPFKNIYLHGLVRDKHGKKMSKSLGNGIDPIEIIEEYGADAFRFTLSFITSLGQDILLDRELFKMGAKFANKIYNSSRFIFSNIDDENNIKDINEYIKNDTLTAKDKWIISRLESTIKNVSTEIDEFRFDEASQSIYKFYWNDYCDWYIELSKFDLRLGGEAKDRTISVLLYVLEKSISLLHPFMPFITEHIFTHLPKKYSDKEAITISEYPIYNESNFNIDIEKYFDISINIISSIRNIKVNFNIAHSVSLDIKLVYTNDLFKEAVSIFESDINNMIAPSVVSIVESSEFTREKNSFVKIFEGGQIALCLMGVIDIESEKNRLKKDIEQYEKELSIVRKKVGNENFISKAKQSAIDTEKRKETEFEDKLKHTTDVFNAI